MKKSSMDVKKEKPSCSYKEAGANVKESKFNPRDGKVRRPKKSMKY